MWPPCWFVAASLARPLRGRRSFSAITGAFTTSAIAFSGSPDQAQDLTQEVFIKMYGSLKSYDSQRAAFMTWMTTITRNLLVDYFRKT